MTFEGRCGPSVDELPEVFKNLTDDECCKLEERYENEPIFRREIGPNIPLWAKCGEEYCLDNLQIDIDFGHFGKVRGIVKCDDSKVAIEWRLGPNFDATDAFISKNNADEAEEIIGLYVQDKDKTNYDWFQYITPMKESAIKFIQSARDAPEGTTFVDWKRPMLVKQIEVWKDDLEPREKFPIRGWEVGAVAADYHVNVESGRKRTVFMKWCF